MLEFHCRPAYQKYLVDPLAKRLQGRISPDGVTLFSLIMGLLAALCIARGMNFFAVGLLLLSGYLDTLDGTLARLSNSSTSFGAVLDICCDRAVEWAIILALFALDPVTRGWESMMMLGSVLMVVTTFLTAGIFLNNESDKSFHYSPGLMERAEAFGFFLLMIFLPHYFSLLAWLFSALVLYTAARRLWQVRMHMKALR